jgi:hypothetical protein
MVEASNGNIKSVIAASGTGYYGIDSTDKSLLETTISGTDFLAKVCVAWENSFENCTAKLAILRTGVVLTNKGGAVPKMVTPIKWGVGAALGSGRQLMPWIHIDDICELYIFVLENNLSGIFNAVSPNAVSNRELTMQLAQRVNRKVIFPNIPVWVLNIMLGEMSEILINGVDVSSSKIEKAGFTFSFPEISKALNNLLPKNT